MCGFLVSCLGETGDEEAVAAAGCWAYGGGEAMAIERGGGEERRGGRGKKCLIWFDGMKLCWRKRKRREVGRGGGKKRVGRRYYKKYEVRGGGIVFRT